FRQITQFEGDVHGEILVGLKGDVRAAHGLEARQLGANLIGRRAKRWERVTSVGTRDRVGPDTGCAFDGSYGCTWNDAAGAIGQGAVDLAGALRRGCFRQDASQTGHERCQHQYASNWSHNVHLTCGEAEDVPRQWND